MIVIGLILLIALVGVSLRVGLIEFSIGSLIVVPLLWQVLVRLLVALNVVSLYPGAQVSLILYLAALAIVFVSAYLVFERRSFKEIRFGEILPLAIWIISFVVALYYCHTWPDFYRTGERLRDYALLAASVGSPIIPVEPWMSSATINYYIYWYRFGHMLSTLGGYPVWELYHVLVAFSISTYLTFIFRLLTKVLGFEFSISFLIAVAIAFGSNVKGVVDWWIAEHSWWGPSRVIKGAINEFPAWSFLLGDLHPHYVNLCAIPFLLLILNYVWRAESPIGEKCLYTCLLAGFGHFFLFGSNAWEIPMWWGLLGAFLVVLAARADSPAAKHVTAAVRVWWESLSRRESIFAVCAGVFDVAALLILLLVKSKISSLLLFGLAGMVITFSLVFIQPKLLFSQLRPLTVGLRSRTIAIVSAMALLLILGCILGSRHIVPEGGTLRFVRSPIELTPVSEMMMHWGIPLVLIALTTPLLYRGVIRQLVVAAAISVTFLLNDAALLIFFLAFLQLPRIADDRTQPLSRSVVGNGLVLAGLGLILLPEFVFLDDPYGGENERMNTIFKIYTTAWFLMHAGAAFMVFLVSDRFFKEASFVEGYLPRQICYVVPAIVVFCMLGFFDQTVDLRRLDNVHVEPYTRGLSEVAKNFPGSKETIDYLTNQPPTVVLEAQGDAYAYTSFISTLSGQTAFLGWSNHVGLLTKKYDEVGRREKITRAFYTGSDCNAKKTILGEEQIGIVVVGKLEREKYPEISSSAFGCLTKVFESGEYALYR